VRLALPTLFPEKSLFQDKEAISSFNLALSPKIVSKPWSIWEFS